MRVVAGLRALSPGRIGGLERYARAVLPELMARDPRDEWTLLVNPASATLFEALRERCTIKVLQDYGYAPWAAAIDACRPDVYFSPLFGLDPPDVSCPAVAMIPDLQHEAMPDFFPADSLLERRRLCRLTARHAAAIVTLSTHAKYSIVSRLDVPAERVYAIPLAAADAFAAPPDPAALAQFRRRLGIGAVPYGFYPANFWLHKNHAGLIAALVHYRRRYGQPPLILLTGHPGPEEARVRRLIRAAGLQQRVRLLGHLSEERLRLLYQGAQFVVFPSLYEGFGLPILEAFASGCPVAAARVTSVPEVAGDAALLFNPEKPAEIARAIHRLATEPALARELHEKGLRRVERFSWKAAAALTHAALGRHARPRSMSVTASGSPPARFIALRADGELNHSALPAPCDEVLCFVRPGARVEADTLATAASLFSIAGGPAAVGATELAPAWNGERYTFAPRFDTHRLLDDDYLPWDVLWLGPIVSRYFIEWARRDPELTAYEFALWLAANHPVRTLGGLKIAVPDLQRTPVPSTLGVRLSHRYFGGESPAWLRAAFRDLAEPEPPRLMPAWLSAWRTRYRQRQFRSWLRRSFSSMPNHTAGRIPAIDAPPMTINPDGWMGKECSLSFNRTPGEIVSLKLHAPFWPYPTIPVVTAQWETGERREIELTPGKVQELKLPTPLHRLSTTLKLSCPATYTPADYGLSFDSRRVSVRVETRETAA